jgi:hypothetical protein
MLKKLTLKKLLFLTLTLLSTLNVQAQAYFRITADFTIKEQNISGDEFYKGKVYYDKNIDQIIYDVTFPTPQKLVVADTQIFVIENETVKSSQYTPNTNQFSIFNLTLSGDLKNFGLNKTGYTVNSVEEADGMTIIEWVPPATMTEMLGKTVLSVKDGQLFGIALFKPDGKLAGKQFFKDYVVSGGLTFPSKIIQITYYNDEEFYKITTFKNIKIDDITNEEKYYSNLID